jgi:hypothetical protein
MRLVTAALIRESLDRQRTGSFPIDMEEVTGSCMLMSTFIHPED